MRTATERARISASDASQQATDRGAVLDVEQLVAAAVAPGEDFADELGVARLHRAPVERLVGQRQHVEGPERVCAAHRADQVPEEVELTAGEVVADRLGWRAVEAGDAAFVEAGVDGADVADQGASALRIT